MTAPSFAAALLAGGKSTRMGLDKALIVLPGTHLPLWRRQLSVLQELRPQEILWSGQARPGLPEDIRVVTDSIAEAGPLAGVDACLQATESDLLLVLAIDLPRMPPAFLQSLLARCSSECGIVVRHGEYFEPLAAVYPKKLQPLASEHLAHSRYAMQDFVREGIRAGLLCEVPLEEKDVSLFQNVNCPEDC